MPPGMAHAVTGMIRNLLHVVFRLVVWILGAATLLMVVVVGYSLFQQSRMMDSIETGMPRAGVVAALGEPRLELEELGFCEHDDWLGDCEAARQSGAMRYLVWKYGIDTYLVVGLDKDGRVVFYDIGDA